MSSNASHNIPLVNDATPPANSPSTPGAQITYEQHRADIEGYIDHLRAEAARKKRSSEMIQDEIAKAEGGPDKEQGEVGRLTTKRAGINKNISTTTERHNTLVNKVQKLVDEEDEELKRTLLGEARQIVQEAERDGVDFGHEDGEAM